MGMTKTKEGDILRSLKELRKITGLSQDAFCKRYGFVFKTYQKWEQGKTAPAQGVIRILNMLIELEIAFGVWPVPENKNEEIYEYKEFSFEIGGKQ